MRARARAWLRQEQIRYVAMGLSLCLVAGVMAGAAGLAYLRPPGQRTIVMDIVDAAVLKPGTQVRTAGIGVGKVSDIELRPDSVRVSMRVDNDVYLGDESRVEVRMLTPAGGYYLALDSAGSAPLTGTIATSSTRPPYILTEIISDVSEKFAQVDTTKLAQNLDDLAGGLEDNPGSVTTMIDSLRAITDIVNHQQTQLGVILTSASEFLRATTDNRAMIGEFVRGAALLTTLIVDLRDQLRHLLYGVGRLVDALKVLTAFYDTHRDWVLDIWQRINNALNVINTDVPRTIWSLGTFINDFRNLIAPGGLRVLPDDQLLSTDFCAPIPGHTC
ncbi:MlaD family protein [Mycolicibacter minnesotensis]